MNQYQRELTLSRAIKAVRAYNNGMYRKTGRSNVAVDRAACDVFRGGLAGSVEGIEAQIRFIGVDYGGSAVSLSHQFLPQRAAQCLFDIRDAYVKTLAAAPPLLNGGRPTSEQIALLYQPFAQIVPGGTRKWANWLVWASKFWHFLNPEGFAITDSLARRFLSVPSRNDKVREYLEFLDLFGIYAETRMGWMPRLREEDGGETRSDVKLWDKVIYQYMDESRRAEKPRKTPTSGRARKKPTASRARIYAQMNVAPGVVRQTSKYADGKPALEIHIKKVDASSLPIQRDGEEHCRLRIGERSWDGRLRRTEKFDHVWISPTIWDETGARFRLVDALIGFGANDLVSLRVSGRTIEIRPGDDLR